MCIVINSFELSDFLEDAGFENSHVLADFIGLFLGNSFITEYFGHLERLAHFVDFCIDID